jgi:hypothetical protein
VTAAHKIGFHINGPRADAIEAAIRVQPRIVKTLDFSVDSMRRLRENIPGVILIGRLVVSPQEFGASLDEAVARGREFAERILREEVNQHHFGDQPLVRFWESLNEVFPEWTDDDTQKRYDDYMVAFGETMAMAGFEPVAFNFGQGNGRGLKWLELYPGTLETYTHLGFHEYDWPTMDRLHTIGLNGPSEPWNFVPGLKPHRGNDGMWRCLRYRRIMNEGIRQRYGDQHRVIITECGMTQGVWTPAQDIGWLAAECTVPADIPGGVVPTPIPAEDYYSSLLWYNGELMKDDYVLGACLFVTGASGGWDTFETLGTIVDGLT